MKAPTVRFMLRSLSYRKGRGRLARRCRRHFLRLRRRDHLGPWRNHDIRPRLRQIRALLWLRLLQRSGRADYFGLGNGFRCAGFRSWHDAVCSFSSRRKELLEQSVEGGSRSGFAGHKVEACTMPRTPDGRVDGKTVVLRPAVMRAVCTVSLKAISISPDEDAGFTDDSSEDAAVGRRRDFGPLSEIEASVVLNVAHRATRGVGNSRVAREVPVAREKACASPRRRAACEVGARVWRVSKG